MRALIVTKSDVLTLVYRYIFVPNTCLSAKIVLIIPPFWYTDVTPLRFCVAAHSRLPSLREYRRIEVCGFVFC